MRDEKEERSKQGQTNKAKQHSTPKAVTFPKKNELPRVGGKGRGGERGEWVSVASRTVADGKQCDAGNAGGEVQLVCQEV